MKRLHLFLWISLVVLMSACEALPTPPNNGGTAVTNGGGNANAGAPGLFEQTPAQVVASFLDAWQAKDYPRMYTFLSSISQNAFPQPVFENRYTSIAQTIGFNGVSYTLGDTRLQGLAAAVQYDAIIETEFGEISDPDRTMRLVRDSGGWRIAWSTMDILNNMAGTADVFVAETRLPRANIYDRNGDLLVEEGGDFVVIYAQQQNMLSVEECIGLVADVTRLPFGLIQQRFIGFNPETTFFLAEVDQEVYDRNASNLQAACGTLRLFDNTMRRYVDNGAAAHVTGYVGFSDTTVGVVGITGLERAFEQTLGGIPNRVLRISEGGITLRELGNTSGTTPAPLQLTIDRDLQDQAVQAFMDAYSYASGNWAQFSPGGAAVVVDVNTGEILAMVSHPGYNPAIFNPNNSDTQAADTVTRVVNDPRRPLLNRAMQDAYFPGSIFKVITLAAVLNEGLYQPNSTFDCQHEWNGAQFNDTRGIRYDWRLADGRDPAGILRPELALAASCNPFFYESGARLFNQIGPGTLEDYAARLGIGKNTALNTLLPETAGILERPSDVGIAINHAIGQGVQTTALQMAMMTASIANPDGTLYQPYLVQRIGGVGGVPLVEAFGPTAADATNLNATTLEEIRSGMCEVVTNRELGTAWFVFDDDENDILPAPYTVCAKTGTAEAGAYPNSWFIAYAPRDNPQIAIAVVVPSSREGSEVAAPITRRILDYYFDAPVAEYPRWWNELEYIPLVLPDGSTGG
jgi:penicillin-binding protein 2